MKNLVFLVILFSFSATTFCTAQTKAAQKEKFQATYNSSKALVQTQTYQFVGEVAFQNNKREKLDSDSNTVTVNKSQISGQVVSLSQVNKRFDFHGSVEKYQVSFNDDKQQISIEFNVNKDHVVIAIKPNGKAFLTVSSGNGVNISQVGFIK